MKKKINIAKILRNKPVNTKLYSAIFGECIFKTITDKRINIVFCGGNYSFFDNGKLYKAGDCCLFPSREMRDWSKFAWKKGDVLISNNGKTKVIFDGFKDNTYTTFTGKHALYYLGNDDTTLFYINVDTYKTELFHIEDDNDAIQYYFNILNKKLGYKFNIETLNNKSSKWTPKPFDKVLVRDADDDYWCADLFSHKDGINFICVGSNWTHCIPYNEKTAKLIGTTNNYKED